MSSPSSPPAPPDAGDLIRTLLQSLGRRSDAESYLKHFRRISEQSFALLVLDEEVAHGSAGLLAQHVALLAKLGLHVCFILDFDASKACSAVPEALQGAGLRAELVTPVRADEGEHSLDALGPVQQVKELLAQQVVPVLSFAGSQSTQQQRTHWLARLSVELGSRKLVFVRPSGALGRRGVDLGRLRDEHFITVHDEGVSVVNLQTDYEVLIEQGSLDRDEVALLVRVRSLLQQRESKSPLTPAEKTPLMVNVTSPPNLLRELFTVRGAGTLIKAGTAILRPLDYRDVDRERLLQLLETTFEKKLRPEFFDNSEVEIYLEEHYRGVALIDVSGEIPLLTKFAVEQVAQGEGIGRDLWNALRREHGVLCWRCRAGNPIAEWYTTLCEQMVCAQAWTVFGVGLQLEQIAPTVRALLARAEDFH